MLTHESKPNSALAPRAGEADINPQGEVFHLLALFAQMMEDGALRKDDPAQVALQFWAPILSLIERSDCDVNPEEVEDQAQAHVGTFTIIELLRLLACALVTLALLALVG